VINILRRSLRKLRGARDGGAVATEFALLMAFVPLMIMAFGIVDYGEVMGQAANLSAIVRGAAEYARGQVAFQVGHGSVIAPPTAADLSTLLSIPAEVFTPPPSSFCTCADGSTPPPLPTCPTPLPNSCRVLIYVAVSGSQSYTPIIPGTWSFPGSVNARTVLRVQ
jgi:hypothetical protein